VSKSAKTLRQAQGRLWGTWPPERFLLFSRGNVPSVPEFPTGLKDEYVPGAVNTVVNGATGESFQYQSGFVVPGTENNVMANPENPNAQLTQQNVNQLANTAVQMQQQAPAPAPEKKEEPQ